MRYGWVLARGRLRLFSLFDFCCASMPACRNLVPQASVPPSDSSIRTGRLRRIESWIVLA
eukprot:scaffold20686_cov42-Attheya_sp.AAC.2